MKLKWGDVGFTNGDVEARVGGNALCPHQHVAIRQRQPKPVLLKAQQHRVIQDAARLIGDEYVLTLTDCALRKIAGCQQLHKGGRVWPGNLDLTLYCHVAKDGVVHQVPKVLFGVAE